MRLVPFELQIANVYGDGSVFNNGKEDASGGYGFYVELNGIAAYIGGGHISPKCTNNIAELMAVIAPLRLLRLHAGLDHINLTSDSKYVVNGINSWVSGWHQRGWVSSEGRPVKNRELWELIYKYKQSQSIAAKWIRGHAGHHLNEVVDSLARYGNESRTNFLLKLNADNRKHIEQALIDISSSPSTQRVARTAKLIKSLN